MAKALSIQTITLNGRRPGDQTTVRAHVRNGLAIHRGWTIFPTWAVSHVASGWCVVISDTLAEASNRRQQLLAVCPDWSAPADQLIAAFPPEMADAIKAIAGATHGC